MQSRFNGAHHKVGSVARHALAVFAEISDAHLAVKAPRHFHIQ